VISTSVIPSALEILKSTFFETSSSIKLELEVFYACPRVI
jgi:hypothetical protein